MLVLSDDPEVATQQMLGLIFYMATFAHVDGEFDPQEKAYIMDYLERLLTGRSKELLPEATDAFRREAVKAHTEHFEQILQDTSNEIRALWTEAILDRESQDDFVEARLKVRCFEIFRSFDPEGRKELLESAEELLMADGHAHPAELKFRGELAEILAAEDRTVEPPPEREAPPVTVHEAVELPLDGPVPKLFAECEEHLPIDKKKLAKALKRDRGRILKLRKILKKQRADGKGKLAGHHSAAELRGGPELLDEYVHLVPPKPGQEYELTVLGDLHGCYSCLKAAVIQSRFFEKVAAFKADPASHPEPRLVLLGDYIDRGHYGFEGVLRAAVEMKLAEPSFVYLLRGNHELFVEREGYVISAVSPAEAVASLLPYASTAALREYMNLFDELPISLIFGELLFVHGGVPRSSHFSEIYTDLTSLNDYESRFYMMWGDPSSADIVPVELQHLPTVRFVYGRLQVQDVLERIGCHTMIRGHQLVEDGFWHAYDGPSHLFTLFSCGGAENPDLPSSSHYRNVNPKALTVRYKDGAVALTPWTIDYAPFTKPERNAFYKSPRPITHGLDD